MRKALWCYSGYARIRKFAMKFLISFLVQADIIFFAVLYMLCFFCFFLFFFLSCDLIGSTSSKIFHSTTPPSHSSCYAMHFGGNYCMQKMTCETEIWHIWSVLSQSKCLGLLVAMSKMCQWCTNRCCWITADNDMHSHSYKVSPLQNDRNLAWNLLWG